jgi:hypothetical protein
VEPKLRVRSSGHGGSGYKHPHTGVVVPGVTTVLKKLDKPAIVQWAVDNTAAYAVANVDGLLNRTQEQGYGFLRWYWKRDPLEGDLSDIRNYSNGVLNDAAELGTLLHDWVAAEHDDLPFPDVTNASEYFWEMVAEWDKYKSEHDIEPLHTEVTLWNDEFGYAGTADGIWKIDGKVTLVDLKTSRNTWDEHWMQLAALARCETMLIEGGDGWFERPLHFTQKGEAPLPYIEQKALLHIRPSDIDKNGNPMFPFAELKIMPDDEYDVLFNAFSGLLSVTHALSDIKTLRNRRNK